jgi:DNA-binding transcriptional regulator YhcF (GntR family)
MRFNNERPIFTQIQDLLVEDLLAGKLETGARLPSARELASSLEVNPNTAARALQGLADTGVARVERGMGYFVAEGAIELARESRRRRFFDEELPRVFKVMEEIGALPSDILERFEAFKAGKGVMA